MEVADSRDYGLTVRPGDDDFWIEIAYWERTDDGKQEQKSLVSVHDVDALIEAIKIVEQARKLNRERLG